MIKCTATEAATRLEQLQMAKVVSSAKNCLFKLAQIRQKTLNKEISELEKEKVYRLTELISLSLDVPYEVESLILIAEIDVINNLFRSVRNSVSILKKLGDFIVECEEYDNEFYNQFATFEGQGVK